MRSWLPRWLPSSFAVLMTCQFYAFPAAPGQESLRVHLKHGRYMEAVQYSVEGTTAHLILVEGGSISFPASLVDRVETERNEIHSNAPDLPVADIPAARPQSMPLAEAPSPIVEAEADSIDALIHSAALRHRLEPDLLAAVIAVESGYNSSAVSPKGAQGLMQLMPDTARDLAVTNPFDPRQNIDAGARYLRQLLDLHDGSFVDALAAYNAGRGRVARYNGVPPYRETIAYINKVLKRYRSPQAVPTPHVGSRAGR